MTPSPELVPPAAGQPQVGEAPPPATRAPRWYAEILPGPGDLRAAVRIAVLLTVAGIPLGVLWWLIAPRRSYQVSDQGAFAIVPESEAAIGSDGWFLILTGVVGLAAALLVWRRRARRGPLMPVALAVGGILCGLVTWQLGSLLGPAPSTAALHDIGRVVLGPLGLRAYGVLLSAPFVGVAGYLVAVCFTQRDDLGRAGPGREPAEKLAHEPAPAEPSVG